MGPSDFYVYEHWRPDLNVPFYVGKGKNGRAKVMHGRGQRHIEIVSALKQKGLSVEIKYACTDLLERAAFEAEMEAISRWRSQGIELINCTDGGDGTWGLKYTDDRREKVSKAHKGREWTPEHRSNMSEAQKGKKLSAEHREKLSIAGKNRKLTDEHKQRIKASLTGKPKSEAHRAEMRRVAPLKKQPPRSAEAKARMSAAQKKRVLSPETWVKIKEALSRAHKGRVLSEESRRKMSLSQTGRKHSEATKQRMREKALEREACKRVLLSTIPKGEKMANVSA